MAQKTAKIDDVQKADKVAPGTSSRPIVVTDRPLLANDPMVVEVKDASDEEASDTRAVTREAKTLRPATEENSKIADMESTTSVEPSATIQAETEPISDPRPEPAEPALPERDAAAATQAAATEAEAARTARDQELEELILSGRYNVPINAVQRKRSRLYISVLSIVALALALLVVDAALDAGLIRLPVSVPHTHFFAS